MRFFFDFRTSTFGVFFLLTFLPSIAFAQGSAPSLFNVKEIILQLTHFGDPKSANACGLAQENIAKTINAVMQSNGVPVIFVSDAPPSEIGVARINLVPEIYTYSSNGLDCTSWISLSAEDKTTLQIPPIESFRNVMVVYWRQGVLLSSSQSSHAQTVSDALQKLASQFAREYRLDQPPSLPDQ